MGFLDIFKSGGKKCACCKKEYDSLPYSKNLEEGQKYFCSKECSRNYRINVKKAAKKPVKTGGGLPW